MVTTIKRSCTNVFFHFFVTAAKGLQTNVQPPAWFLMVRGLKCVPILSKTHTDNQDINTAVRGPYTAAAWIVPDFAMFPERQRSTWPLLTLQNFLVAHPGAPMTFTVVVGHTRLDMELNTDYTVHMQDGADIDPY